MLFSEQKEAGSKQFKDGKATQKYFINESLNKTRRYLKTCPDFRYSEAYKDIWTKHGEIFRAKGRFIGYCGKI